MADVNQVMLIGRLTRDAEMRFSQSGFPIMSFALANNQRRKRGENQWEDEVHFIDCTLLGRSAEAIQQYMVKGKQVAITGRLVQDRWTDQNSGQTRSRLKVMAFNVQLLGGGQGQQGGGGYQGGQQQGGYQSQQPPAGQSQSGGGIPAADDFDDDIPF